MIASWKAAEEHLLTQLRQLSVSVENQSRAAAKAGAEGSELVVHTTQSPVLCIGFEGSVKTKASHLFNLLDARGVISVTERAAYIGRVRALAKSCCEVWIGKEHAGEFQDAADG